MFLGIITLDLIREIIFDHSIHNDIYIKDLMILPEDHIKPDDPMDKIMKKFEETGAWNLPLINDGKYVGYISKSNIFSAYRQVLIQLSEE